MKIIQPSAEFITPIDSDYILKTLEIIGRTAYQSFDKDPDGSKAKEFIISIIDRGHESVIEHISLTARFIVDRGVSHELVRHRIASFTQESTRYCNYANGKYGGEISFIDIRPFMDKDAADLWTDAMLQAELDYRFLINQGCSPQIARSILPNSLKTEVIMTANLREWRHFFKLRCSKAAHPQMRQVANMLLNEVMESGIHIIFKDIWLDLCKEGLNAELGNAGSNP